MIQPVILCGGSGTRLWPLSRESYPKQFLSLQSEKTMLQETLARLDGISSHDPIVVCNEEHRFIVAEQLRDIENKTIILEPAGKNTAPALALAAFKQVSVNDPVLLVMPSDHVINNKKAFYEAIKEAESLANKDHLVVLGVPALAPETGYGYIKASDLHDEKGNSQVVSDFVEKPNYEVAKSYIERNKEYEQSKQRKWLWNTGIYICKASKYLNELKKFRKDIYLSCKASMENISIDKDFTRIDEQSFVVCPSDSIDYAVMEPASKSSRESAEENSIDNKVMVVSLKSDWDDIGSFGALWEVSTKDSDGNVLKGDIKAFESKNSLVVSDHRLVTTLGVDDLVIIDTKDTVLVANKAFLHKLKEVIRLLQLDDRNELKVHREVFRPWGKYDLIDWDDKFKVKRLTVKPEGKLSLQSHMKRSEYWVVVSGVAKVNNDNKTSILTKGESIFIPVNAQHSLENIGDAELQIIEVQSGQYLGEDDIVRYEDHYGRHKIK